MRIIRGQVQCLGANLVPGEVAAESAPLGSALDIYEIFSPDAYALLSLTTLEQPATVELYPGEPYWSGLADFFSFKSLWGESLPYEFADGVELIFPNSLFIVKQEFLSTTGMSPFIVPPLWCQLQNYLSSALQSNKLRRNQEKMTKLMVMGEKGTGKSTFLRFFLNALLNDHGKVLVIDLDPGQTEFSFPGCLSVNLITRFVLGPPFTHLERQPEFSTFLATCSPGEVPREYLECLRALNVYIEELYGQNSEIPILINTMGWVTGKLRFILGRSLFNASFILLCRTWRRISSWYYLYFPTEFYYSVTGHGRVRST